MSLARTEPCPCCGITMTRTSYDIGSGDEFSCSHCEWCWGAHGQALNPDDADWYERGRRT